jgi:hypothetical protein
MGVDHLATKRTGRRRGSKNGPPWLRDLRWVSRNLGKKDAEPPTELSAFLLDWAREHPDRFHAWVIRTEGPAPKAEQQNGTATVAADRGPETAQRPHNEQKPASVPAVPAPGVVPAKPMPDHEHQNGTGAPHDLPASAPTAKPVVKAEQLPQNVGRVFMSEKHLVRALYLFFGIVGPRIEVISCEMDQTDKGVLFTVSSPSFARVADGEMIPEVKPMVTRGR